MNEENHWIINEENHWIIFKGKKDIIVLERITQPLGKVVPVLCYVDTKNRLFN